MGVSHVLWVVDLAGANTQFKVMADTMKYLNMILGLIEGIDSAVGRYVFGNQTIAPGTHDSVVFVVDNINEGVSLARKVGGNMTSAEKNNKVLGKTVLDLPQGAVAEVYWERCYNSWEVAASIFHESAHLKSGQDDSMHNAPGVRLLSEKGDRNQWPSWRDLDFYQRAIKRQVKLRTKAP